jgi:UDP-N-acetylglucosamine transferase subunit ALG13
VIFVTTGTQLPFDRLINAMDAIAAGTDEPIIAQAGAVRAGRWPHLDLHNHLAPSRFEALFAEARVVVGHAGMGTLLAAGKHRKPLILLPRSHALGEHRNDHQMATARHVETLPGVHVAWDTAELPGLVVRTDLAPVIRGDGPRKAALIDGLRRFIGASRGPAT